jgi:hypothetical protein
MSTVPDPPAADPAPPDPFDVVVKAVKGVASLRLTVVLFALAVVLVFFGTVAMMTKSLWTVVDEYFRSAFVWIPFDLVRQFGVVFLADKFPDTFAKGGRPWGGAFPFPGGWTIGAVMLVNLVAAHLVRFKLTWKRSGVIVLHLGVIVLMVGELITGMYAVESTMMMRVGEAADFVDVTREYEIAVTDPSDPAFDTVTTIPQRFFQKPGAIDHDDLPFRFEVVEYWRNTAEKKSAQPYPTGTPDVFPVQPPVGPQLWFRLFPRPEGAGVDSEARGDIPSVRVRLTDKGTGADLGTHLLSLWAYPNFELNRRVYPFPPTEVKAGGKTYTVLLRNKRVDKPYSVKLLKFEHGKYPGTDIPKDFASTVEVTDKDTGDAHEVRIWMNNPLRHRGDSLFQHAVLFEDSGTVLQVVRNPGRLLPYISCLMVTAGMLIHFGIRLSGFLRKKGAA